MQDSAVTDRVRPVQVIEHRQAGIQAQAMVDCRLNVHEIDGIGDWQGAMLVGGTLHLSAPNAAAGQEGRRAITPVVATGILVNLGSAAELTHANEADVRR
jgi:hypothetical protein